MASKKLSQSEWLPGTFTPSLTGTEKFKTDGDWLLEVIDAVWKSPDNDKFQLDDWQRWLIRHVLERYPDNYKVKKLRGQLRYRQVVISMGRQNGKSVLGAVFGLYGLLLHGKGPEVVSVASSVQQAEIVYKRVKHVIDNHPALAKRFKSTGTRGIRSKVDGVPASYVVKAGAEDSLQGVTISLCLYDEIHITKPETWDAVVFGTSSPHPKGRMVLGITTAGDDNSALLKRLYKVGRKAAAGEEDADERFGFFCWEAPEHLEVTDPIALKAANPAIACGRFDIDAEINNIRNMPENTARRYRLNQFVASEVAWVPGSMWSRLGGEGIPSHLRKNLVFAVDRSENWGFATITAAVKHEKKVYTEVVASIVNPDIDTLENACVELKKKFSVQSFVMDASVLKDLSTRLKDRGIPCEYLSSVQMQNVAATAFALISSQAVIHKSDPVVLAQFPKTVLHNSSDGGSKVSRKKSSGAVDSVISTVEAIWAAETMVQKESGLYFFPQAS